MIVGIFSGIKDISEGFEQLLIRFHIEPNALDLAQDSARGQFSDQLMRLSWERLFWSRRYVTAVSYGFSSTDLGDIWKGYMKSVEDWDANLMVNIVGVGHYYGEEKRTDFEDGIAAEFDKVHNCLLRLRYASVFDNRPDKFCLFDDLDGPEVATIASLNKELDGLNAQLYCFAIGLSKQHNRCIVFGPSGEVVSGDVIANDPDSGPILYPKPTHSKPKK